MDRNTIDTSSGGTLVNKMPEQAWDLIARMAENTQQFGSRDIGQASGNNNDHSIQSMKQQLSELTSFVRKMVVEKSNPECPGQGTQTASLSLSFSFFSSLLRLAEPVALLFFFFSDTPATIATKPERLHLDSAVILPVFFLPAFADRLLHRRSPPIQPHTAASSRRHRRLPTVPRRPSSSSFSSSSSSFFPSLSAAIPPSGATPSRVAVFVRTKMLSASDAVIQPSTASALVAPPSCVSPAASVVQPPPHSTAQQSRLGLLETNYWLLA
ncbi:uncharacterized protein LOC127257631 [Andrographis paniculata]|uniref:uncharacterized protein LOC127257631 n=1 Tax=Andrographis paniculata TaxID=175694 RepID=UPI0021E73BE5|nr:uncharacterized protein LOC127257631 [Andrographis paniculata]